MTAWTKNPQLACGGSVLSKGAFRDADVSFSPQSDLNCAMSLEETPVPDPQKFLKAKFRIGSVHGRVNYKNSEKVFHSSEAPKAAQNAKRDVLDKLIGQEGPKKEFVVRTQNETWCGRSIAPWDAGRHEEDKHYAKLVRTHHGFAKKQEIKAEQRRKLLAKRVGGSWNASTTIEKPHTGMLGRGKVRKTDAEHRGFKRVDPSKTSKVLSLKVEQHKTLLQRHADQVQRMRTQKLKKREREQFKEQLRFEATRPVWNRTRATYDHKEIQNRLEATHTRETLIEFMKSQELSEQSEQQRKAYEDDLMRTKRSGPKIPKAKLSYSLQGGKYVPKTGMSTMGGATIGSSKARRRTMRDPMRVVERYEHLGRWELSKIDGCMAWSCCMNEMKDSRGCTLVEVNDKNKWQFD